MDYDNYFTSNGLLTSEKLTLVEWEESTNTPFGKQREKQKVKKEMPIQWVHEISTMLQYRHGGKLFDKGSEYTDYYGHATSLKNIFEDFEHKCKYYSITSKSSLVVEVVSCISSTATLGVADEDSRILKEYPNGTYFGSTIWKKYPDVRFMGVADRNGGFYENGILVRGARVHSPRVIFDSTMTPKIQDDKMVAALTQYTNLEYLEQFNPLLCAEVQS